MFQINNTIMYFKTTFLMCHNIFLKHSIQCQEAFNMYNIKLPGFPFKTISLSQKNKKYVLSSNGADDQRNIFNKDRSL